MDQREPIEIMKPLLQEVGFTQIDIEILPVADYIIHLPETTNDNSKIAITMKSTSDFLESVYSGHMHTEIEGMLGLPENYMIMLLMWQPRYGKKRDEMMRAKDMSQVLNLEYLPVHRAQNRIKAVEHMRKLYKKYERDQAKFPLQFRRRVMLAGNKDTDPLVKLYMNLPGIGESTARLMRKKYPSMEALIRAIKRTRVYDEKKFKTKKNWHAKVWYASVDKLGGGKAKDIEDILVGRLETPDDFS